MKPERAGLVVCLLATVLLTAPFCGKAFHIDDPFYIRIAQHITQHPLDYYGLTLNWYGRAIPVHAMHVSPPLVPYYLAAWGAVFGWGEVSLHLSFLPFALLFVGSTYSLASYCCRSQVLAALLTLCAPVTVVTAGNIMLDLPMSAFFTAAIAAWCAGMQRNRTGLLVAAGVFAGLSALSKYFGLSLVPLLFVYTLASRNRPAFWPFALCIPLLCFGIEQACNYTLYGHSVFANAGVIAREAQTFNQTSVVQRGLSGLSFTGGCLFPLLACGIHMLPNRRRLLTIAPLCAIAACTTACTVWMLPNGVTLPALSLAQLALFSCGGVVLAALVLDEVRQSRSPETVLLVCWTAGTFVFATAMNWSVTARTILPMAPAVALLITRRIERARPTVEKRWTTLLAAAACAVLALCVGIADYTWAASARDAAFRFAAQARQQRGTVRFQGHWGWQYYMELQGFDSVEIDKLVYKPGDFVISPENNSNVAPLPEQFVYGVQTTEIATSRWVATNSRELGAGFYSNSWGPLPFAFGKVAPDRYHVLLLGPPRGGAPVSR